jgi:hypothetical protein
MNGWVFLRARQAKRGIKMTCIRVLQQMIAGKRIWILEPHVGCW